MNQGRLNLLHPISASSGSSASIFTISGGMSEGMVEVVSQRRLTLVMYCSNLSVRELMMETSFWRKSFVSDSSSGICWAVPIIIWSP